jgi:multiple sugar transport system substrate-binding protein
VVSLGEATGDTFGSDTLKVVSAVDTAYQSIRRDAILQGLYRDLTPLIEADAAFEPGDFFPGVLEAFRWGGGTWALPTQAELTLLFYDVQAFDEAGVPRPTPDWTRDDFLAATRALTVRQDGEVVRYGFLGDDGSMGIFGSDAFVMSAAGGLAASSPRIDSPAVAGAVRWYADLTLVHDVSYGRWWDLVTPGEYGGRSIKDLVTGGRAAMWGQLFLQDPDGWVCTYPEMQAGCDGEIGVALFPTEDGPVASAWMYGYWMSAGTVHPQESWRWLRFLTHRRLLGLHLDPIPAGRAYHLPARRSVAEESGYFDQFDEETRRVAEVAAEHLYVAPPTEARYQLWRAIQDVFDGTPVEEALEEAQAALDEALAAAAQATPIPIVVATPQPEVGPTIAFAPPLGADLSLYRTLAESFGADNPDVQVQIIAPDQAENADCFAGALDLEYESHREGRLNVQSFADGDAGFPLDDFHSRFLEAARYQGDLWGVPTQARVRVVFYNRDMFDAAGEPYPEVGWTLDEFLARAVALTTGEGEEKVYGFVPLGGHAVGLRTFLALQGVDLWDEERRPRFDAPDVVAAVTWYANLALAHGVTPVVMEGEDVTEWGAGWEEREALVREGRVAMWTGFAGRQELWPPGIEAGMAPLPLRAAGAKGVTSFRYEGLFIAEDAADRRACWEWIKHLSVQQELVSGIPARASVLESPEFAARVGEEEAATYQATLEYADLWDAYPGTPEANEQMEHLVRALADIFAGADPEAALLEAQGNVYN